MVRTITCDRCKQEKLDSITRAVLTEQNGYSGTWDLCENCYNDFLKFIDSKYVEYYRCNIPEHAKIVTPLVPA